MRPAPLFSGDCLPGADLVSSCAADEALNAKKVLTPEEERVRKENLLKVRRCPPPIVPF